MNFDAIYSVALSLHKLWAISWYELDDRFLEFNLLTTRTLVNSDIIIEPIGQGNAFQSNET